MVASERRLIVSIEVAAVSGGWASDCPGVGFALFLGGGVGFGGGADRPMHPGEFRGFNGVTVREALKGSGRSVLYAMLFITM